MAATRSSSIAFIVLMSGPALTGEKILLAQAELIGAAEHVPEEQVRANADLQRMMFAAVRSGTGWEAVTEAGEKLALLGDRAAARGSAQDDRRPAGRGAPADGGAGGLRCARRGSSSSSTTTRRRRSRRSRSRCWRIFGEKDLQVPAAPNQRAMEEVFAKSGHKDHRIVVLPGANHLYQQANDRQRERVRPAQEGVPARLPRLAVNLDRRARRPDAAQVAWRSSASNRRSSRCWSAAFLVACCRLPGLGLSYVELYAVSGGLWRT